MIGIYPCTYTKISGQNETYSFNSLNVVRVKPIIKFNFSVVVRQSMFPYAKIKLFFKKFDVTELFIIYSVKLIRSIHLYLDDVCRIETLHIHLSLVSQSVWDAKITLRYSKFKIKKNTKIKRKNKLIKTGSNMLTVTVSPPLIIR